MRDLNRKPKFIMYYMFPVDSILIHDVNHISDEKAASLCLPEDGETRRKMLPLFLHADADEIVKDITEMGLTGLACVGVDGTMLSVGEIRSSRYRELIEKCRQADLIFMHGFPFADTYDNLLTNQYPHIRQMDYKGNYPFVGWGHTNRHFNVDYGSDEFITYCRRCIDALAELGVEVIDYAEPDHYPYPDNGYGQSLTEAWKNDTGEDAPHPFTVAYRRFMEDRNLRGIREIGRYAKEKEMQDHLTASPLIHGSIWIGQNYGKYSKTDIDVLSTTFHMSFAEVVRDLFDRELDMRVPLCRVDSIGCIEAKSLRRWGERHAVYAGPGQGYAAQRYAEYLKTVVQLYQMDFFLWDYCNLKNESMYMPVDGHEDPEVKFVEIKKVTSDVITAYMGFPQDYKEATIAPHALVYYAKESDYLHFIEKEYRKYNGALSLYSTSMKLLMSDIPFMFIYDGYTQALAKEASDVPLLIVDEAQYMSPDTIQDLEKWFSGGKALLLGGELSAPVVQALGKLSERAMDSAAFQEKSIDGIRNGEYLSVTGSAAVDGWAGLMAYGGKTIVYAMGTPGSGLLIYSAVPVSRLFRKDLEYICRSIFSLLGRRTEEIHGTIEHELVRYKNGGKSFIALKNQDNKKGILRITTDKRPSHCFPRNDRISILAENEAFITELALDINEVRILEL